MSPDGGAALLGIMIKDQDKRPLVIPPEWERMSRGTSVVKTKFLNRLFAPARIFRLVFRGGVPEFLNPKP
jgi:hypothetical protein